MTSQPQQHMMEQQRPLHFGPERLLLFHSPHPHELGITIEHSPLDGHVRITSLPDDDGYDERSPGGSSTGIIEGKLNRGDVVCECAGVNLRRPVSEHMWKLTVGLMRVAPRPIEVAVAEELDQAAAAPRLENKDSDEEREEASPTGGGAGSYYQLEAGGAAMHHLPGSPGEPGRGSAVERVATTMRNPFRDPGRFGTERSIAFHTAALGIKLHRSPTEGIVHILHVTPYKPFVAGGRNDDYNPPTAFRRGGPNEGALEAGDVIMEVGGVDLRGKLIGVAEWADMVHFIKCVGRPLEMVVAKDGRFVARVQEQEQPVGVEEVRKAEAEDGEGEADEQENVQPNIVDISSLQDASNEANDKSVMNKTTVEEEGQEVEADSTLDNICFSVAADDVCNNFSIAADDICNLPCGDDVQPTQSKEDKPWLSELTLEENGKDADVEEVGDSASSLPAVVEDVNGAVPGDANDISELKSPSPPSSPIRKYRNDSEIKEETPGSSTVSSPIRKYRNDSESKDESPSSPVSSSERNDNSWMKNKFDPSLTPVTPNGDNDDAASSAAGSMAGAALPDTKDRPWMNNNKATPSKIDEDDDDSTEAELNNEEDSWIKNAPMMTPASPVEEDISFVADNDDSWMEATPHSALATGTVPSVPREELWISMGSETKAERTPMAFYSKTNPKKSPEIIASVQSPAPVSTVPTSPARSPVIMATSQPASPLSPGEKSPASRLSISPPSSPMPPMSLGALSAASKSLASPASPVHNSLLAKPPLSPISPKPSAILENDRGLSNMATVGTGAKETKSVAQLREMFSPIKTTPSVDASSPPASPKASGSDVPPKKTWQAGLVTPIVSSRQDESDAASLIATPGATAEAMTPKDQPAQKLKGLFSPIVMNPPSPKSPDLSSPTEDLPMAQLPPSSPLDAEFPGGWSATSPMSDSSDSSVESYHGYNVTSPTEESIAQGSATSPFSETSAPDQISGPSPMEASADGDSIWSHERVAIPSPVEDQSEDVNDGRAQAPESLLLIPLSPVREKRNELARNILKEKRGSPVRSKQTPTKPVADDVREEQLPAIPTAATANDQIQVPQLEPTPSKSSPKLEPTPGPEFQVRKLEPTPCGKQPLNESADVESPFHNVFLNNLRNGFDSLSGAIGAQPAAPSSESRDDTDQHHGLVDTKKLLGNTRIAAKPEKRNHLISSWTPSLSPATSPARSTASARSTISIKEGKKIPILPPHSAVKKPNVGTRTPSATKLFSDRSFRGDGVDSPFVGNIKFATPTQRVPQSSLFSKAFVVQHPEDSEGNANGENNNTRWFQTDSPLFVVPNNTDEGTNVSDEASYLESHPPRAQPPVIEEIADAKGLNTSAFDMADLSDGPEGGGDESFDSPSFELNETIVYANSMDALDCCGVTSPLSCGENMFEGLVSDCGAGNNFEMFKEKKEKVNGVPSPRRKNLLSRLRNKSKKNKAEKKKKNQPDYYGTLDNQNSNEKVQIEEISNPKGAPRNKKNAVQLKYQNMRGKSIASASQFSLLVDDEICV